jgi:hypothetical protein
VGRSPAPRAVPGRPPLQVSYRVPITRICHFDTLPMPVVRLPTLRSGGQTGVDRAALDAALAAGIPVTGWCPRGRRAEDGPLPLRYPLRETPSADYAVRTRLNVRDADATLILLRGPLAGGTALTADTARALGRGVLVVDLANPLDPEDVAAWVRREGVQDLNVAGPRESEVPGIYAEARAFLTALLAALRA